MSTTAAQLFKSRPVADRDDSETLAQQQKIVGDCRMQWFHWLVVGLSVLLTLAAWYISHKQVEKTAHERFQREADQVLELVKERMKLFESALRSAVSMIDSNGGNIDYIRWLQYANSFSIDEVYPGVNGIGVIFNVKPGELAEYLRNERAWRPEFDIYPRHGQAEYWPITYIEPVHSNLKAVGLDMAFESHRYEGVKQARDSGKARVTAPITLVQDARKTPGFLFFVPFYLKGGTPATVAERRQNIVGVTYAPFIMVKLMQGTLALKNRQVTIRVSDNDELLFEDNDSIGADQVDPDPLFSKQSIIQMYGREWTFDIATGLSFRAANTSSQPYFILLGGIVIDSLLLLLLFLVLSKANHRALCYADLVTRQLQVKTQRLEKSNRDLEEFAYVASHDLKSPLNAIKNLVDWIEEDLGKAVPQNSRNHLSLLRSRATRMSVLLDDLLGYSRVGRYDYGPEEVSLKNMVSANSALINLPRRFSLQVDDFVMRIPRIPFELVLRNLIANAVKHHDRDSGSIAVSVSIEANDYILRVRDDGPGISPQLHQRALEMFQTLESRDKTEGSGMGLAMTRRVAEHYGGTLTIESDGSRGTVIVISWPREEQAWTS